MVLQGGWLQGILDVHTQPWGQSESSLLAIPDQWLICVFQWAIQPANIQ